MKLSDRALNHQNAPTSLQQRPNKDQQNPSQNFKGKLDQECQQQDDKNLPSSSVVMPGYVKQMITKFSLGCSNDYINGLPGGAAFKVPLLHSTRSSFKSEKPKPFHYPVLLANRSSIPTKPYFTKISPKNCSNGSVNEGEIGTKHVTSLVSIVELNMDKNVADIGHNGNDSCNNNNNKNVSNCIKSGFIQDNSHQHCEDVFNIHEQNNTNNNNNINNTFNHNNNNDNIASDLYYHSTPLINGNKNCVEASHVQVNSTSLNNELNNSNSNDNAIDKIPMMMDDNPNYSTKDSSTNKDPSVVNNEKNGEYFLGLTLEREGILNEKCTEYSSILLTDIPDDASGKIRAAIGKANLLITKKFKQFRELCVTNLTTTSADQFHVTTTDLEGFWDLVMIQIDDVETSFQELNEMRNNAWKEIKKEEIMSPSIKFTETHGLTSKKLDSSAKDTSSPTSTSASKAQDRNKEKLRLQAAMKAGRRQRKTSNNEDVLIFFAEKS